MKILFCCYTPHMHHVFSSVLLKNLLNIHIDVVYGDITKLHADAIVSPANSFGFMDGGVDLVYSRRFGWGVQERLQEAIKTLPFGELLIGQALGIETHCKNIQWVISAPTMRTPSIILDPLSVYLSTRAAVAEALRLNITTLAFPGMGTGTGCVPYDIASHLMIKGCFDALNGTKTAKNLWEVERI